MKISIKNSIYQAVIDKKWLDISYVNKEEKSTSYYIGIQDIDIEKGLIYCDIFNPFKDSKILKDEKREKIFIKLDSIVDAMVLTQSYYEIPNELTKKVLNDPKFSDFLDLVNYDNNILRYLSDCYRLDNDPFLKETVMIDGIDLHTLSKKGKYILDDDQFKAFLEKVFKKPRHEAEIKNKYETLAINRFSIDINDKQYVVAYRSLTLNFKDKSLQVAPKTSINKSFLISEEKRATIGMYLDMDPNEFAESFDKNEEEYIAMIKGNFRSGEIVNSRPTIFFLGRNPSFGIDATFEAIHENDSEGKMPFPLKSFFGRNRCRFLTGKDANLVVYNREKVNIDQLRVVYNAMVNHVTYVKGPPGTGKTETIFNVLLSSYANDKTVLVCSNNNHPVNDIFHKMMNSFLDMKEMKAKGHTIVFPLLRLGNNDEMKVSISYLKKVLSYAEKHQADFVKEEITEKSKVRSMSGFENLKSLLVKYEARIELFEQIETLKKIRKLTSIDRINEKLDEQIAIYQKQFDEEEAVKDEDVMKYVVSASEDSNFQNYVYYSSLARYKKLLAPPMKELREIVALGPDDEAVKLFNRWLKEDINLRRLLNVFPILICTNISSGKLASPKPQFDLLIMDESGQCNEATSLIPISRANNLLLVGDTNQLQPVTLLEESVNEELMKRYGVGEEYNYINNSILSTMMRKDNNSKSILLRYHYRCGKKIAEFVNKRFYGQQLKLFSQKEGSLVYVNVKNTYNPELRNAYQEEAKQIARLIKENNYKDVGIITPFVNQSALINAYLAKEGISEVKAGTIHTLQGSEKSVIIMSSAICPRTGKKTMDWIKNNHELINVGVTRAKEKFIFVGDKEAIDALSKGEENDIKVLSDYVANNGKSIVPPSDVLVSYDFSNGSKNEKEFFDTIQPYFNRRRTKFKVERNVQVKEAIKDIHPKDLSIIGKKEFDVVVFVADKGIFVKAYHPIVVFEVDGGEHIGSKKTAALDRQKEEICKKYGIKLIRIANSAVKDYELIISLFEFVVGGLPNLEEAYTQMTLFDQE